MRRLTYLPDYLWDMLGEQFLECLLLLGSAKDALRNHGERPSAVVEHERVGINERLRIHAPLKL